MELFEKFETSLEGCYEILPKIRGDNSGTFIKTFPIDSFKELGFETDFKEEYCSSSIKNVLRGMHFQTPPADHVKLVYCAFGKVLDVVVDLRKNSSTFGQHQKFYLDSEKRTMLYIPQGLAHGFLTLSDKALMVYNLTSVYSPENDTGILWNSCGIDWQCENPILSEKDKNLVNFADFDSPF